MLSLLSEKWKVLACTLFEKWNEIDSRSISRNEISPEFWSFFLPKSSLKYGLKKCKVDFIKNARRYGRAWVTDRIYFHSFFLKKKDWKIQSFRLFPEVKSEKVIFSLFFKKWKWNWNGSRLRTGSEISEICKNFSRILEKRDSRWGVDWTQPTKRVQKFRVGSIKPNWQS